MKNTFVPFDRTNTAYNENDITVFARDISILMGNFYITRLFNTDDLDDGLKELASTITESTAPDCVIARKNYSAIKKFTKIPPFEIFVNLINNYIDTNPTAKFIADNVSEIAEYVGALHYLFDIEGYNPSMRIDDVQLTQLDMQTRFYDKAMELMEYFIRENPKTFWHCPFGTLFSDVVSDRSSLSVIRDVKTRWQCLTYVCRKVNGNRLQLLENYDDLYNPDPGQEAKDIRSPELPSRVNEFRFFPEHFTWYAAYYAFMHNYIQHMKLTQLDLPIMEFISRLFYNNVVTTSPETKIVKYCDIHFDVNHAMMMTVFLSFASMYCYEKLR